MNNYKTGDDNRPKSPLFFVAGKEICAVGKSCVSLSLTLRRVEVPGERRQNGRCLNVEIHIDLIISIVNSKHISFLINHWK